MTKVTTAQIKELRALTGAGMLDCKNALAETGGDIEAATDLLRKKGLAAAAKKEGRETLEGMIGSYVHAGAKIAGMVEINCETDFVAKTDQFQSLARDLAMHVVAENPAYLSRDQVPAEVVDREKDIYREQMRGEGKPDHILDRIISGKLDKFYEQVCLMEQAFIKEPEVSIEDLIKRNVATLGENIQINRFSRLAIGEG